MSDAPAPGPSAGEPGEADGADAPVDDAPEVPTGEPDAVLVEEATAAADETLEPAGETVEPETEAPEGAPQPEQAGDADARVDLAAVTAELAEVRAGVESMLPDLAATAREETLGTGLAGLKKGLDEMVRLTRRADEHVAELHGENQRLRAGELASATMPMIRDLVRLHDEVAQLTSASHPEAQADLELVGSRLLDTLARWGLTPFSPATGEKLDATKHQGVGRVASSDGEPGAIATVRKPGFAHDDGRTFRAAEVEVFAPPPAPPAPQIEES